MRHGATWTKKQCSIDGCTNIVQKGGVCIKHGAKKRVMLCSVDGCTNRVRRRGVCMRHGAYSNPYDESTAFSLSRGSAHETTATPPNHPIASSSTNQEQSREDPPRMVVCQVIDCAEV